MAREPRHYYEFVVMTTTFNYITKQKVMTRAEADEMFDRLCNVSDTTAVGMYSNNAMINGWCNWAKV